MTLFAWNFRGLGSNLAVRILTDEVKENDPTLVFLAETKAGMNRIEGIQRKLDYPATNEAGAWHYCGRKAP